MVIFKFAEERKADMLSLIVINYFSAVILGFITGGFPSQNIVKYDWFWISALMGVLFIAVFFIIGLSTAKAGVAITSITGKMSVIMPISFSILWLGEPAGILKITGIILTIISLFLIVYSPGKTGKTEAVKLLLPVILFFGVGTVDTLIKFTQHVYIRGVDTSIFSSVTFLFAGICGTLIWFFRLALPGTRYPLPILPGISLGIVNYGSLYFMVKALDSRLAASSIIYGLNSIGIVILSVIIGMVFFAEKLTPMKKAGIILTAISIVLLSIS
jgi:drug/metabolite transporter (DMT)-like permease